MCLKEKCKIITFNEFSDERGNLVAVESNKDIPFDIKRIFYIFNSKEDVIRGQHANKNSELILICLSGSCTIKLYEENEEMIVELNKANIGLYIPKLVWKDMYNFTKETVLLVLSSEYYSTDDYIRK